MENIANIDTRYLKAILDWLDVNLEGLMSRWQVAGQKPDDRFRGLYISDSDALSTARQESVSHWGSGVSLPPEKEAALKKALDQAVETIRSIEYEANKSGYSPRLLSLAESFNLSEFEWWAFIICLAPALDLRYEKIYGYLQDDVTATQACLDLILLLLVPDGLSRLDHLKFFNEQASLRKDQLLFNLEGNGFKSPNLLRQAFSVAPPVFNWLLDQYTCAHLGSAAKLVFPEDETASDDFSTIFEAKNMPSREVIEQVKPLVSLYGEDMLQQELLLRRLASAMHKPLLKVPLEKDITLDAALERLLLSVRDACMLNALLYIQGIDILIDQEGCLLPAVFETLSAHKESLFLGGRLPIKFSDSMPGNDYPLMSIPVYSLTALERQEIWQVMVAGGGEIDEQEWSVLAGQFNLSTGDLVAASSMALSLALQNGRPLQSADLFQAARFYSGHHLSELARKIEPRYAWNDLVLPETPMTMLQELVSMVKSRPKVLEEWGLGQKLTASAGVSALFTGQSGTGKTLAAQIIAHELGIDLYRIDLSTIVSKYIGETEKNLEHIFNEAQTSNAILFFDEADAIFGKRSEVKDAHDRYANIEVGYLLQRMEAYSGLAILATNLRANLDEAFTRRLQFIITFPFPDEENRLRIWNVLMPPGLPKSDSLDLGLMAKKYKLAGGNIRNIIVSAAYLAANDGGLLTMKHLMHGARREFQKMGRLISDNDFDL